LTLGLSGIQPDLRRKAKKLLGSGRPYINRGSGDPKRLTDGLPKVTLNKQQSTDNKLFVVASH